MTDDQPVLVALVGDTHINSKFALPPGRAFNLAEGDTHRASRAQCQVWRAWTQYWKIVDEAKEATKARLYVVLGGDLLDLNRHSKAILISLDEGDVKRMGTEVFAPISERCDELFIVRGTEAHAGGNSYLENNLAEDLDGTVPDDARGTASWYWLWAEFGGVTFDVTHHPIAHGTRRHTRVSGIARQQWEVRARFIERGDPPPDVSVHFHAHQCLDSGATMKPHAFCCPSWSFDDPYGSRIGFGRDIEPIGGLLFLCQGGRYELYPDGKPLLWTVRRRRKPWRAVS